MCACRYSAVTGRLRYLCYHCQGIDPMRCRPRSGITLQQFLKQRPDLLVGCDFFLKLWHESVMKTILKG